MKLEDRVKLARKSANLSMAKLAAKVGVSNQAVLQWENGQTKSIDGANLVRAAYAMGVEPLWLAADEGPMHANMMRDDPYQVPRELSLAWQKLGKETRQHILAIVLALADRTNKTTPPP